MRSREQAQRDMTTVLLAAVVPDRARDLARLQELADGREPTVTVVGKYNHGKSRLLNELMGRDVFAVADKRETVALAEHLHRGVRWLDAPGLDAGDDDDRHASEAAWLRSDVRLFVHAAKEGELDAGELALLDELRADEARTGRRTIFVLSQADQLADEGELGDVLRAIAVQVPAGTVHAVSATRHRRGVSDGKTMLVEKSGVPPMRAVLDQALAGVPAARARETNLLLGEIDDELTALRAQQGRALDASRQMQVRQRQAFDRDFRAIIAKVGRDIEAVLDAPIPDYAVVPDTSDDKYRITQAKLERARIQIAYSRACIEIDGFLAGLGVVGLPMEQETAAGSMNTVMVAVLGVSVKFRSNLRGMFCEASGRERMQEAFTRYYELSKDRTALREAIARLEAAVEATWRASAALRSMAPDA